MVAVYPFANSSGGSITPLTVPQATNPLDTTTGSVSGQLLAAAIAADQTPGMAGVFDATANAGGFPTGLTIAGVAIRQGDYFIVTVAGTVNAGVLNGPNVTKGNQLIALKDGPTVAADWAVAGGGQSAVATLAGEQLTGVTNGQTVFSLPTTPTDPTTVRVEVNGTDYHNGLDFTLAGATVTWLNGFTLAATDVVYVYYI